MNVQKIIDIIETRRDALRHAASLGTADDPLVASAAQVAWEKAEEYDSLLAEIRAKHSA
jgi:hypothetical protein